MDVVLDDVDDGVVGAGVDDLIRFGAEGDADGGGCVVVAVISMTVHVAVGVIDIDSEIKVAATAKVIVDVFGTVIEEVVGGSTYMGGLGRIPLERLGEKLKIGKSFRCRAAVMFALGPIWSREVR